MCHTPFAGVLRSCFPESNMQGANDLSSYVAQRSYGRLVEEFRDASIKNLKNVQIF